MQDPTSLLNRVKEAKARQEALLKSDGWQLKNGIQVFVNPPFLCPKCGEWDETRLIWMVDTRLYRLLGLWDLNGNNAFPKFTHAHPHVSGSQICKGSATSADAALFASISYGNPYHDVNRWLQEVGHADVCKAFPKSTCALCGVTKSASAMGPFVYSSKRVCIEECDTLAKATKCYACFADRDPSMDERRGFYCEPCFPAYAQRCPHCDELWNSTSLSNHPEGKVCQPCRERIDRKCAGCGQTFQLKDLNRKNLCLTACATTVCNWCGYNKKVSEVIEKKCASCRERYPMDIWYCSCDRCECENTVSEEGILCNNCDEGEHND